MVLQALRSLIPSTAYRKIDIVRHNI